MMIQPANGKLGVLTPGMGALEYILQPELYPDLYQDFYHKVRINYYPLRGDNKKGWLKTKKWWDLG